MLRHRRPRRRAWVIELLGYGIAFALVGLNLDLTAFHLRRPFWITPDLLASLIELGETLPPDAAIWTSWGFGYLIADVAGVATFDDPELPDPVVGQLMSRSVTSADPAELAQIVSFVGNRGKSGLDGWLSEGGSYRDLMARLAESYEPVRGNVYLLFAERMTKEFPAYYRKGNWDFEKLDGPRDGYDVRRCQKTLEDIMVCRRRSASEVVLDLGRGLVAGRHFVRKAVFVENGAVRDEIDYPHEDGMVVQVLGAEPDRIHSVQFISEAVFRSNFNQMYMLGRFDPHLYTEVYNAFPTARLFRLNPAGLPPE